MLSVLLQREMPKKKLQERAVRAYVCSAVRRRAKPGVGTVLTGGIIAEALTRELQKRVLAPASIIREIRLGPFEAAVADCLRATTSALDLFEVKGETDQPARLARQVTEYDRIATTCTLVTTPKRAERYLTRIPEYWGVMVARVHRGRVLFEVVRAAGRNPGQDAYHVAGLISGYTLRAACKLLRSPAHYVHDMRDVLAKRLPLTAVTMLAARDAALRREEGSMHVSPVVHIGAPEAWPSVQEIVLGANQPRLPIESGIRDLGALFASSAVEVVS